MANLDLELSALSELHYRELTAAQIECSDLEYAFKLQLEETLQLSTKTAKCKSIAIAEEDPVKGNADEEDEMSMILKMQAMELEKFQQEVADHRKAVADIAKFSKEVHRINYDAEFARSILEMSEDEWDKDGDNFERPFEFEKESRPFKLYFKGMAVSGEDLDADGNFCGAGVAVYDPDGNLVTEMGKPLESGSETSRALAEYLALIEGLTVAISLGMRNVTIYGDCVQVHRQVTGRWLVRQRKINSRFEEVKNLFEKLDKVYMVLLTRSENRHALSLAEKAIRTQLRTRAECQNEREKSRKENCSICLEDKRVDEMYEVESCHHRYCHLCMSQHAEVKLRHGCIPVCPFERCNHRLTVDECKKFLSCKWIEVLTKRLEEAAIPDPDKIYCPYTNCSALMTKAAVDRSQQACSSSSPTVRTECLKCHRYFCVECRVPWHGNMLCREYQAYAPQLHGVDAKLHLLAKDKRWRRCIKCKHMIELAEGCNHITCRCGFEFCYVCGAEWKNKKQTCKCVLWDEHNIIREPLTDDDYYSEDDDDEDDLW